VAVFSSRPRRLEVQRGPVVVGQLQTDARAFPRAGIDGQAAACHVGPVAHAFETEAGQRVVILPDILHIEAAAVVNDAHGNAAGRLFQAHRYGFGVAMFEGVVHGFLEHPVDYDFGRFGDVVFRGLEVGCDAGVGIHFSTAAAVPVDGR